MERIDDACFDPVTDDSLKTGAGSTISVPRIICPSFAAAARTVPLRRRTRFTTMSPRRRISTCTLNPTLAVPVKRCTGGVAPVVAQHVALFGAGRVIAGRLACGRSFSPSTPTRAKLRTLEATTPASTSGSLLWIKRVAIVGITQSLPVTVPLV